jgi:excisionase family DNA binding protein
MTKVQCGDRMLRVPEVAERLGLQPSTVRRMIMERKIDVFRPTKRSVRIAESTVDAILTKGYRPAVER